MGSPGPHPVHIRFTPLFEATWSYAEFERVMPFGPDSEGQAFARSGSAHVEGERLSGSYRLAQFPRWRADGLYLPDLHGLIQTEAGECVMTRAAGFGIHVPGAEGRLTVTHWMRLWTGSADLAWLNRTVAFGVGSFADDEARVSYFIAAPAEHDASMPPGAPGLEPLGTARWEYPEHESVHVFGDREGVGFAASTGIVEGGVLAGAWRGWHYPTYLRDGLYQMDAHAEIATRGGRILSRHGGVATPPEHPAGDLMYEVVQHATFLTEEPSLAKLNRTLAVGVGLVRSPGLVSVTYYGLSGSA